MRENTILKRAVAIQNSKLNDKAGQEAELQQLRQAVSQYQERTQALEMSNYALTLHLQKATSGSALPHQRNPDIF